MDWPVLASILTHLQFSNYLTSLKLGIPFYGALTYLVGIGSIVTFTAYVYMLTHLPPAKASIYAYVNPIVAILMGAAILGEKLTLNTLVFSLATVAGIWLVNRSK